MIGSTRSNFYGYMLLLFMLALLLAVAWPAVASAAPIDEPDGPTMPPGSTPPAPGDPGDPPAPEMTPTPAPEMTPPPTPEMTPPPTPEMTPPPTPEMTPPPTPEMTPPPTPEMTPPPIPEMTPTATAPGNGDMMSGPHVSELANRIIKHVATPAQLVMAGGGFQFFFIGPDGNTVSGPTIPSFADLAEMHPSGEWVSLLDAVNPLSGKQVYVDYIPNEMKIRVFTYYPDKGMDVDKPYIFNFGSDLNVNVEAW